MSKKQKRLLVIGLGAAGAAGVVLLLSRSAQAQTESAPQNVEAPRTKGLCDSIGAICGVLSAVPGGKLFLKIAENSPPAKVDWSRPWTPPFFLMAQGLGEQYASQLPNPNTNLEKLFGVVTKGAVNNCVRRVGTSRAKCNAWARNGDGRLIPNRFGVKNGNRLAANMKRYVDRNNGFVS